MKKFSSFFSNLNFPPKIYCKKKYFYCKKKYQPDFFRDFFIFFQKFWREIQIYLKTIPNLIKFEFPTKKKVPIPRHGDRCYKDVLHTRNLTTQISNTNFAATNYGHKFHAFLRKFEFRAKNQGHKLQYTIFTTQITQHNFHDTIFTAQITRHKSALFLIERGGIF